MGVVLAGGLSSRMQTDKTQLVWQGKTLLEHTSSLLLDAGCEEVIISHQHHIADRYPGSGPLAGIDSCLNFILQQKPDIDAMLIMPIDMPLMSIDLLQQLRHQAEPDKAVYYSAGRFPLLLPVSNELSALLVDCLTQHRSGSGVSIRQILKQLHCQIVTIDKDHETAFYNCNTPQQW